MWLCPNSFKNIVLISHSNVGTSTYIQKNIPRANLYVHIHLKEHYSNGGMSTMIQKNHSESKVGMFIFIRKNYSNSNTGIFTLIDLKEHDSNQCYAHMYSK